ncbi:hypothetical protein [Aquihabitans sp. McL0605]|uniref:hypothetical protein n=1 Tax=Aquihabitans sp. McL0605 TaxID=3415671 RepID=UPI003CE80EB6
MRSSKKLSALALVVALPLAASACGGGSDAATPASTTTTIAGKVDVKTDDGKSSVEYTDKDGNTTTYGADASLPEGWPQDLAPPATVRLVSSSSADTGGKKQLFVTGESTAPFDQLHDGIKAQLTAAGFDITNDVKTGAQGGSGGFAGVEASDKAFAASISIAEDTDAKKVTILYTLTPSS